MIHIDPIYPEAWRWKNRTSSGNGTLQHKPVKAMIGEKSYQCKQEKHKLQCTKLNCPCPCHDEEREATRISKSAELGAAAEPRAATGGGSARRTRSGEASGADARLRQE